MPVGIFGHTTNLTDFQFGLVTQGQSKFLNVYRYDNSCNYLHASDILQGLMPIGRNMHRQWQAQHWSLSRFLRLLHIQVFPRVTTDYGILPHFLKFNCKWRQLHELQPPDRRRCSESAYPSFSSQVLRLTMTILNTATTDGLMVQYQSAITALYLICLLL